MPVQRSGGSQVSHTQNCSHSLPLTIFLDRENLEWCGPDFGPRANESEPLDTSGAKPTPLPPDESEDESEPEAEPAPEPEPESGDSVVRRWLQEGEVGEASANCYSCPNSNSTDCAVTRVYEPASRVISQCVILAEEVAWLVSLIQACL